MHELIDWGDWRQNKCQFYLFSDKTFTRLCLKQIVKINIHDLLIVQHIKLGYCKKDNLIIEYFWND